MFKSIFGSISKLKQLGYDFYLNSNPDFEVFP